MKIVHFFRVAVVLTVTALSFHTVQAQSPDRQMGVGITAATNAIGGHVCYAISPAFHLGAQLGIVLHSQTGGSSNRIDFGPYGKFIFLGTPEFKPFIGAQFGVTSSSAKADVAGATSVSSTNTALSLFGGAEYFINRNFGAFGRINVIDIGFGDNSFTDIGLGVASVGIEWFFQ